MTSTSSTSPDPLHPPVVIVGAGAAGATAARTLITRDAQVRVVLIGDEPHPPYDRTQLSKAVLTGERDAPSTLYADDLADERLELITDRRVVAIDRDFHRITLDDGAQQPYRVLVLACGAAPRMLPLPGADLPGVHTVRALAGLTGLRAAVQGGGRLVIVGGGLIGLEVAAAARTAGVPTTVVEVADQLLGRVLPARIAEIVAATHAAHGVEFELGARSTAFTGDAHVRGVALADGRVLPADTVVVAIGVVPRTELAVAADLTVNDGVVVDTNLRTDDPTIWAVGDIARLIDAVTGPDGLRTEAWSPALAMGQHVAAAALGDTSPFTGVPWMWSDQYDLTVQAAGAPVAQLEQVTRGAPEDAAGLTIFGLRDGHLRGVAGVSHGNGVGRTVRGAMPLIEDGIAVTADELADPSVDLRRLARDRR